VKTRSYAKTLTVVDAPPTKETLKEALTEYKPVSVKDFIVTCMLHVTAVKALERGWLDEPGTYEISDIWFDKRTKWNKVICRVRKIS
jgi:hypothetical protein